jgi:cytochrome b subunit of formate dehydrogenase
MSTEIKYQRFTVSVRIEHWAEMAAFFTLGLTGLIQRYSEWPISLNIMEFFGGIENVRIIHRGAAVVLMLAVIYHLGSAGYKFYVKRYPIKMLPNLRDVTNAWGWVMYNLGRREKHPQEDRFTFAEKFEYWAFVWGTVVMGLTGFALWNPIATSNYLPGVVIPAAKIAHSLEAVLAVLAIIIWHFYNVHVKMLNKSMFNGKLSEEEMVHEHPLELADIKAGVDRPPPDPKGEKKRLRIFMPVYLIVVYFALMGVYFFVTGEETALATVPPASEVEVFAPLTPTPFPTPPPTPTAKPILSITWDGGVGELMETKCGTCHNDSSKLGGLDLTSYQAALEGGNSGPGFIPGDPDNSLIVTRQETGDHPGQLSPEELELLREWIAAGAPEN